MVRKNLNNKPNKGNIMRCFYITAPCYAYGFLQYGFNKEDAIKLFKNNQCITRMPNGYKIVERE